MNSEKTMVFSEELCASVLPGMVESIKDLILLNRSEQRTNFLTGSVTSAIILGGHTCELLLKYKLEREGTLFEPDHDLYKLYDRILATPHPLKNRADGQDFRRI